MRPQLRAETRQQTAGIQILTGGSISNLKALARAGAFKAFHHYHSREVRIRPGLGRDWPCFQKFKF